MRAFTFAFFLLLLHFSAGAQCTASFTAAAFNDSVTFTNTTNNPVARYYWNFGDGDGSYDTHPTHFFPDDGNYTVTLYLLDSINGCTDAFDATLQVTKPDTFPCFLDGSHFVTTASNTTFLTTVNNTSNCPPFTYIDCDAGPGLNGAWSIIIDSSFGEGLWLSRMQVLDTVGGGYGVLGEFYQTAPVFYSSAENYEDCSANFEVVIDYQMAGANVQLRAMNRNATSYEWSLAGFGNPITFNTADLNYSYPYTNFERAYPWIITLTTSDAVNNCTDTVTQQILVQNPGYEPFVGVEGPEPISLVAYPNPAQEICWIECPASERDPVLLRVFDHTGRLVHEEMRTGIKSKLALGEWENGLYVIEASRGSVRTTRKLLIMH